MPPCLSAQFPHMWKLRWLPSSQASAAGKAPQTGVGTTQRVSRLMWNVGSCSRAQRDTLLHGTSHLWEWDLQGSQRSAGRLRTFSQEALVRRAHSFQGLSTWQVFPTQAVPGPNLFWLRANITPKADDNRAQGESRKDGRKVMLLS